MMGVVGGIFGGSGLVAWRKCERDVDEANHPAPTTTSAIPPNQQRSTS